MACKKIGIKKSATMISLVVTLLLVIGMFLFGFLYLKSQTDAAGIIIDAKYNDTFSRLSEIQTRMNNKVNAIQTNLTEIVEAPSVYTVAVNGLKGLGNTMILLIGFIGASVDTTTAMTLSIDVVPSIIVGLAIIGIIAFVVFLILSNLKGDPNLV